MRITVTLGADDLLALRRTTTAVDLAGEAQFAGGLGEPYLYATAQQLEGIADHFLGLAQTLRKETR